MHVQVILFCFVSQEQKCSGTDSLQCMIAVGRYTVAECKAHNFVPPSLVALEFCFASHWPAPLPKAKHCKTLLIIKVH